jgi:MFS family permease
MTGTIIQPIYISEVSPATIRGRLVGLYELGWQIGAVVGFFINYVSGPFHSSTSR